MRSITCARRLPVLKRVKRMTTGSERLVRRVGVILPDLVVPRRRAMKLRRVSMMHCRRSMVPCY